MGQRYYKVVPAQLCFLSLYKPSLIDIETSPINHSCWSSGDTTLLEYRDFEAISLGDDHRNHPFLRGILLTNQDQKGQQVGFEHCSVGDINSNWLVVSNIFDVP